MGWRIYRKGGDMVRWRETLCGVLMDAGDEEDNEKSRSEGFD